MVYHLLLIVSDVRILMNFLCSSIFGVLLVLLMACSEQVQEQPIIQSKSVEAKTESVNEPVLNSDESDTGLREDELSMARHEIKHDTQYKTIEWTDLIPKEDLDALLDPPSYVTEAEEGSIEDQISNGLKSAMATEINDAYQRALVSKNVVAGFDGQAIKLAGFVVPLEFDNDHVITEFFLVPFFGACVHVPAPPPNQIIFVKHPTGFKLNELYNPIWVMGVLSASLIENDMATSAYALEMAAYEPYRMVD